MPIVPTAAADLVTVRDLLRYGVSRFREAGLVHGHGASTALDEAAYLILETLHLPLDQLDPYLDARLTLAEREAVVAVLHRRVETRKPAAYITGKAYIRGLSFKVDERVIVPRSYIGELLLTEGLADVAGGMLDDPETVGAVLDLCTGSGCLALIAAQIFPRASVDAVDISADALAVAAQNVAEHPHGDRVTLHQGDLFAPVAGRRYDLILCNPPYVSTAEMAVLPEEYRHEPAVALAGGEDGLDVVRRLIQAAPGHLLPGGALMCEVGTGRDAVEAAFPELDLLWLDSEEASGEVFWWQP
jgi:ribosomal protein L3 glutamine methyltransferase